MYPPAPVSAGAGGSGTSQAMLRRNAPHLARQLQVALRGYVVPTVQSNYGNLAAKYVRFCELHGLQAWPADGTKVGAWVLRLMTTVMPSSLKVYLAAVRYAHINEGHAWHLQGNETLRRILRYVKRRFASDKERLKLPVSLHIVRLMLAQLPRWPDLDSLAYDDLLFACVTVVAVCGFLRGGEFLFRPGQSRPLLLHSHVQMQYLGAHERSALVVHVPQPKAEYWRRSSFVPIFGQRRAPGAAPDPFDPILLWRTLCRRSPCVQRAERGKPLPAFHYLNGKPLEQKKMMARTLELATSAGVSLTDDRGRSLAVRAASWRAGGVSSAVSAGVPETVIKELGRWKSSAWERYLLHTSTDLGVASERMWACASSGTRPHSPFLRVGAGPVGPGPIMAREDEHAARQMR